MFELVFNMDSPHSIGENGVYEDAKPKWLKSKDGVYTMIQDSEIVENMEPGIYNLLIDSKGSVHARPADISADELYILPVADIDGTIKEIDEFWKKAEHFAKLKFKHKRGYIFYGEPGTGKTSLMNILMKQLIAIGGMVFIIRNPQELIAYIEWINYTFREVQPDTPVIAVMENIDIYMDGDGMETTLLEFLGGTDSVDHHITLATTNKFDDLNELILRPSRLDKHIYVGPPSDEVKKVYLQHKGLDEVEAAKWAKDLKDFSIAEIKEVFVAVKVFETEYNTAKAIVKGQSDNVSNKVTTKGKKGTKKLGF